MQQKNNLELALHDLKYSRISAERTAYEWIGPIAESIASAPKKNDGDVAYLDQGKFAATMTKELTPLLWYRDDPEFKNIIRQAKVWKVILLAMQQTKDIHSEAMPHILNILAHKLINPKATAILQYALFMAKDLGTLDEEDEEDDNKLNSFCSKLAAMSNASLGTIPVISKKEIFCNQRQICLYNQLLKNGYTQAEITTKMLATYDLLEQEFEYADQLSSSWATRHQKTDQEQTLLQTQLLNMLATSVLLQDTSINPKQKIIAAAENLIGNTIILDGVDDQLLNAIIKGRQDDEDKSHKPMNIADNEYEEEEFYDPLEQDQDEEEEFHDALDQDSEDEEDEEDEEEESALSGYDYGLIYGEQSNSGISYDSGEEGYDDDAEELIRRYEAINLHSIEESAALSRQKQIIADTASRSSRIQNLVVELLREGFLDSSFEALLVADETTKEALTLVISNTIKSLSTDGLSNFGLDLPADSKLWPISNSSNTILQHQKYHHDKEYKSILTALEPDITSLLPLIAAPGLRDKLINLVEAVLEPKPDKMYYVYAGIIALINPNIRPNTTPNIIPASSESPERKIAAMLSSGDTPKHISNLILAILHNKFDLKTTNGKPLLQMLEPALTVILKSALVQQKTHEPLMRLFRELHNETIAGNQTLTLLKSPHNMTHIQIAKFLSLSTKEQAKSDIPENTRTLLQKQILFKKESAIRRNNAIIHIIGSLPFITILDVHRTILFGSNSIFMKMTYPIQITLLTLCLPIIASLPTIVSTMEYMAQPSNRSGNIGKGKDPLPSQELNSFKTKGPKDDPNESGRIKSPETPRSSTEAKTGQDSSSSSHQP